MAQEISNLIKFNTYKFERGGLLVDMFNQFNARVGDQGTELAIQWETSKTETKINLRERGLHFFGSGSVGQYLEKLEDGTGFKMSADASTVEWEDKDGAGSLDDGITVVKLPKQFFPQKGIFFGYFGLKDSLGNIFTSVNVWFRVLGGVPTMGAAIPYFVTEFDEVLERCNGKIVDALAELREKYQAEVKKNEDMSAETRAALSKLADAVGAIQAQIDAGNVVTLVKHNNDIKAIASMIEQKLAQMNLKPEAFKDEAALKAKYPDGETGLMVTVNTGHKWIWADNRWNDCGPYQTAEFPRADVPVSIIAYFDSHNLPDWDNDDPKGHINFSSVTGIQIRGQQSAFFKQKQLIDAFNASSPTVIVDEEKKVVSGTDFTLLYDSVTQQLSVTNLDGVNLTGGQTVLWTHYYTNNVGLLVDNALEIEYRTYTQTHNFWTAYLADGYNLKYRVWDNDPDLYFQADVELYSPDKQYEIKRDDIIAAAKAATGVVTVDDNNHIHGDTFNIQFNLPY